MSEKVRRVCGNCRLYEVLKEVSVEEQRQTLDGLGRVKEAELNAPEKAAYANLLFISIVPGIKLGRRMSECEKERRPVMSTASCDHPDKFESVT